MTSAYTYISDRFLTSFKNFALGKNFGDFHSGFVSKVVSKRNLTKRNEIAISAELLVSLLPQSFNELGRPPLRIAIERFPLKLFVGQHHLECRTVVDRDLVPLPNDG